MQRSPAPGLSRVPLLSWILLLCVGSSAPAHLPEESHAAPLLLAQTAPSRPNAPIGSSASATPRRPGPQGKLTVLPKPSQAEAFEGFAPGISVRWDEQFLFVEGNGIPTHPMMTGITAWQQQVPLPQPYTGQNAWRIPLHPVPAREPRPIRNQFLRGAIAVAANGIPIFNPQNNRGEVSADIGELDQWGGHCGRADDYHYHAAPLHLQTSLGPKRPIAFALDGYPLFGLLEPDGSTPQNLDAFHGHDSPGLGYHYHASQKYPFVNGGFHGEVVEKDGQVDPQPRANPVRPALQALRGAKITGFESADPSRFAIRYEVQGDRRAVLYAVNPDGSVAFEFQNGSEGVRKELYPNPGNRSGGSDGGRGRGRGPKPDASRPPSDPAGTPPPPTPGEGDPNRPRRNADPENSPRKPWIQVHGAELDANGDGIIAVDEFLGEAKRTFAGYDSNHDGRLSREEYAGPNNVRSPMGGFVKEHPDKLDADGDGFINEAEFLREVRRMFDKMDLNHDGKLSPDEWRDLPPPNAVTPPPPSKKRPAP